MEALFATVMKREFQSALKQQPDALLKGDRSIDTTHRKIHRQMTDCSYLSVCRHASSAIYLSVCRHASTGITIIIKKNGKVGTRRFGVPIWEALVDDVAARTAAGLDVRNI